MDADVVKTTRLESSIDVLKGEEQLKAETHESVVERLQIAVVEKQKLETEVTTYRETVAQFGEELATAEQLREEVNLVIIGMQKEIDDSERLCMSHEQLIEQVQKESQDSKDQAKASMSKEAQFQKQLMEVQEIHGRVEFQMKQYKNQLESERGAHDDCKEEMNADRRRYAEHLEELQLEADRLKWEEPQEMAWCAMTTEGESGSSQDIHHNYTLGAELHFEQNYTFRSRTTL